MNELVWDLPLVNKVPLYFRAIKVNSKDYRQSQEKATYLPPKPQFHEQQNNDYPETYGPHVGDEYRCQRGILRRD